MSMVGYEEHLENKTWPIEIFTDFVRDETDASGASFDLEMFQHFRHMARHLSLRP